MIGLLAGTVRFARISDPLRDTLGLTVGELAVHFDVTWSSLVATGKPLPFFIGVICDTQSGI